MNLLNTTTRRRATVAVGAGAFVWGRVAGSTGASYALAQAYGMVSPLPQALIVWNEPVEPAEGQARYQAEDQAVPSPR